MTNTNQDKLIKSIFSMFHDMFGQNIVKNNIINFFTGLGLSLKDNRIKPFIDNLTNLSKTDNIDLSLFTQLIAGDLKFIVRCLKNKLVIPDFAAFCAELKNIYDEVMPIRTGGVATYIPQLMRVNPEQFGVSICTIDGQLYSIGDAKTYFCVQSGCKPINYCLIQNEHGEEIVHRYIGKEPSGHGFNVISLNSQNLPHNPLINAGAIMACSLLKSALDSADRFDYVMNVWETLCGHVVTPRFNNAVYLSEKMTADRNYAIGHFIREKNVFPPNTNLTEILEFYFQCCSIEMTTEAMAVVAGTLANAGVCPVTNEVIFSPDTVKNCLSLMSSCGMYDFSGEFAFEIGLPAKSGVSGVLYVVVPNVMGLCIWSPRLDAIGNSVRGISFCRELVKRFNFHIYDSLVRVSDKKDPRYKEK